MSFIIEQKVGKYIYLYECTSYRDKNGNPKSNRVTIGKIEMKTGKPIYRVKPT